MPDHIVINVRLIIEAPPHYGAFRGNEEGRLEYMRRQLKDLKRELQDRNYVDRDWSLFVENEIEVRCAGCGHTDVDTYYVCQKCGEECCDWCARIHSSRVPDPYCPDCWNSLTQEEKKAAETRAQQEDIRE